MHICAEIKKMELSGRVYLLLLISLVFFLENATSQTSPTFNETTINPSINASLNATITNESLILEHNATDGTPLNSTLIEELVNSTSQNLTEITTASNLTIENATGTVNSSDLLLNISANTTLESNATSAINESDIQPPEMVDHVLQTGIAVTNASLNGTENENMTLVLVNNGTLIVGEPIMKEQSNHSMEMDHMHSGEESNHTVDMEHTDSNHTANATEEAGTHEMMNVTARDEPKSNPESSTVAATHPSSPHGTSAADVEHMESTTPAATATHAGATTHAEVTHAEPTSVQPESTHPEPAHVHTEATSAPEVPTTTTAVVTSAVPVITSASENVETTTTANITELLDRAVRRQFCKVPIPTLDAKPKCTWKSMLSQQMDFWPSHIEVSLCVAFVENVEQCQVLCENQQELCQSIDYCPPCVDYNCRLFKEPPGGPTGLRLSNALSFVDFHEKMSCSDDNTPFHSV